MIFGKNPKEEPKELALVPAFWETILLSQNWFQGQDRWGGSSLGLSDKPKERENIHPDKKLQETHEY